MKICQNAVSTKEKQLMKWMGIFLAGNFPGREGIFQERERVIFRVIIPPGGIFLELFFLI